MDLPKISLDGVKSRFGFASDDAGYERRSSRRNDYADDYDDYDGYDDGYSDDANDSYGASSAYEPYNQVTTRASGARRSTISSPRLVSATDVRASTRMSSLDRTGTGTSASSYTRPRSYSSTQSSSFRTLVDATAPAPTSPAGVNARKAQEESNASLLSNLPTPPVAPKSTSGLASRTTVAASSALGTGGSSYDPFNSLTGASTAIHTPSRSLEVIRPLAYNDVERVAKILRAGDVAIIALGETPEDLSKRVLDFSFGVASALDATVDLVAPKVFAITTGSAISDAERMRLHTQGVI